MRATNCEQTERIARAAALFALTREQNVHAAQCRACSDAIAVSSFMEKLARGGDAARALPDPNVLWVRAQFARQQQAQKVILRPISFLHLFVYLISAVLPAAWITWKWPRIYAWVTDLQHGMVSIPAGSIGALSWTMVWLAAGVIGLLMLLSVHAMLAEEW